MESRLALDPPSVPRNDPAPCSLWRCVALAMSAVVTILPCLALLALATLTVRIKFSLGYWPFHGGAGAPSWLHERPGHPFPMHNMLTQVTGVFGAFATLGFPLLIPLRWWWHGRRLGRFDVLCILSGAMLLYLFFGPTRGWGEWFYD